MKHERPAEEQQADNNPDEGGGDTAGLLDRELDEERSNKRAWRARGVEGERGGVERTRELGMCGRGREGG